MFEFKGRELDEFLIIFFIYFAENAGVALVHVQMYMNLYSYLTFTVLKT